MSKIVDRLKILEYRLSQYAIATSIKRELREIIEQLEQENKPKTVFDEELKLMRNWKKDPKKVGEDWFQEHVRGKTK